jgi:hypothetical protein
LITRRPEYRPEFFPVTRIAYPLIIMMMAVATGSLRLKSDDVMTKDDTVGGIKLANLSVCWV